MNEPKMFVVRLTHQVVLICLDRGNGNIDLYVEHFEVANGTVVTQLITHSKGIAELKAELKDYTRDIPTCNLMTGLNDVRRWLNLKKRSFNTLAFPWTELGWIIPKYAPYHFHTHFFNWKRHGEYVVEYAPQLFDASKFNWEDGFSTVLRKQPDLIEPVYVDWLKHYTSIMVHAPGLLEYVKFNWKHPFKSLRMMNNIKEYHRATSCT